VLAHGCLTFAVSIELLRWGVGLGWLIGGVRGNEGRGVKRVKGGGVTRTVGHNTLLQFLVREPREGVSCSTNLECADLLEILAFEDQVDVRITR